MRLKTISRRSFLKGAGVAALAVAAAGMMTGCSSSSSSKKDPVSPTPTPVTKPVEVKYVDSETGAEVCTKTVNVKITELDVTDPKIASSALPLPEEFADKYSVIEADYPVQKDGDKYSIVVRVKAKSGDVTDEKVDMEVHFYIQTNFGHDREDVTAIVASGALMGQTMKVAKDATTVDVSGFESIKDYKGSDDCYYELGSTTGTVENGEVWVWVKRIL